MRLIRFRSIGGLYRDLAAALTRLAGKHGEKALFSGDLTSQVGPDTVALPGLITIGKLADAAQAVDNVVQQGEGAPGHDEHSHYGRLVAIRDEYDATSSCAPQASPALRRAPAPRPPQARYRARRR